MTHHASHNASHTPRARHRDEHADSADRLPPLNPATWTEAQRACAQEIIQGPRGALIEPFVPLLRSPELCTHVQRTGEYLRYRSAIGLRLSELAILVTACHWRQQVEWSIHAPIAMREGIAPEVVQALAEGRRPDYQRADEALVHDFTQQSLQERRVSDATWAACREALGEQGVVDLMGIVGYYTMLSIVMNAAQTPPPPDRPMRLPARPVAD
jgi:4-carboxymuconolactone decarboxylase